MRTVCSLLVALLLAGGAVPAVGQPATSPLTVDQIMQDPETWVGAWPSTLRWHESGEALYFDWNPKGAFVSDSLYMIPATGGSPEKVAPEERRAGIPTFDGWKHGTHTYTADFQRKVYAQDGDLYLYTHDGDTVTRLTDTPAEESDPRFSPDGTRVLFVRDTNIHALTLATGLVRQMTDLREGQAPPEPEPTPDEQFLKEQQTALFETIREEQEEQDAAETQQKRDAAFDNPPPTFHTGARQVQHLQIDPTERFVTFALVAQPEAAEPTVMTDYVTASGDAEMLEARPKVGHPPGEFDLHVQDLARDTTYTVDLHQLPGAYDVPQYLQDQGVTMDSSEAKRALYSYGPYWSGDGEHAVLVVRADDNKDRWIVRMDAASGDLTVLDRQHDDAWIGGPGIGAYGGPGAVGWMANPGSGSGTNRFYFQSEATGYSHLYVVDVASGETQQLTSGPYVIARPRLSQDGSTWTFAANRATPHERHLYRMDADGDDLERITTTPGQHYAALHPDDETLGLLHESSTQPPEVALHDGSEEGTLERITESTTDAWERYDWRNPEIIRFEASDGVEVPAQIFEPETPNGAAVLFVHGAGYAQNVVNGWKYYFREYMFHNMLTDLGYTVLNVDYRGSAGYGRDWRTAIYRHMGGRDLGDYVDASAFLADTYDIDPERQFIYGGSYGGFLTLMALFTAPDAFGGGAALRSVTDWAHYSDTYTSNILNTPQTDSLAYARSSPIYFADGLEDPLLMPHGLIDTNVQPQDIFRLTQRLIELGKEDWELAIYPVEPHSFTEPTSWQDEYRRIFELIETSVGPRRNAGSSP